MWDPKQYNRFSDQRSRPFYELMNRVGSADPVRWLTSAAVLVS
jgi:trans-aconitate methyltransferase